MIQEVPLYSGPVKKACDIRPYGRAVTEALWRANGKPPVELVVADLERINQLEITMILSLVRWQMTRRFVLLIII